MASSLRRLLSRSPSQIVGIVRTRARNSSAALWARLNPADISEARFLQLAGAPPQQELALPYLAAQTGRFFAPFDKTLAPETLAPAVHAAADETIAAANAICDHVFDLLGSGAVSLGPKIDWHRDFKSGKKWPVDPVARLTLVDPSDDADVKIPWELSRFQHLSALGRAYLLTGEAKYPEEFTAQVLDWLDDNPCGKGVNWACTMDVAIRAVNWIWAYYLMAESDVVTDEFRLKLFHALYVHGRFVASHLEWGEVRGNHYLSDIVGLIYLGLFFQGTKEGGEWLALGQRELEGEMTYQVYEDGVDQEGSIPYQRLVVELFTSAMILLVRNGRHPGPQFIERLERMIDFIDAYTKPDGSAPMIGDADDGRLQIMSEETRRNVNDHTYLLAVGAALFDRAEWKRSAGLFGEEAWWLMGDEGTALFEKLPDVGGHRESIGFEEGGIYVMRHEDEFLVAECAPVGLRGTGGHGHNDALSIEVFAGDKTFVTDSGTFVYTADFEARDSLRATGAHNVLQVDGHEMADLGPGLWEIEDQARAKRVKWATSCDLDKFEGIQYGYQRLRSPVTVRRAILFDKRERAWLVEDTAEGEGRHSLELLFHFTPNPVRLDADRRAFVTAAEGSNLVLLVLAPGDAELRLTTGWISPSYGMREEAPVAACSLSTSLPASFRTLLIPFEGDIGWSRVERLISKYRSGAPE